MNFTLSLDQPGEIALNGKLEEKGGIVSYLARMELRDVSLPLLYQDRDHKSQVNKKGFCLLFAESPCLLVKEGLSKIEGWFDPKSSSSETHFIGLKYRLENLSGSGQLDFNLIQDKLDYSVDLSEIEGKASDIFPFFMKIGSAGLGWSGYAIISARLR